MSSRSSSLGLSSPSNSSVRSIIPSEGDPNDPEFQLAVEPPRPTRQDYQTYTALVRNIDKGDSLVAKRIIASHDQLRRLQNSTDDTQDLPEYRQALSSTWPLQLADLPPSDPNSLEDSILAFASAYIRDHNLVLPLQSNDNATTSGLEDLDEIIPDFLLGLMETVDQLLDNLAVMRPAATRKKRSTLKPMDWRGVISAGVIGGGPLDHGVLLETNQKVRDLLHIEGDDLIKHRLAVLQKHNPPEQEVDEDQPGPKTRPRDVHRPHHLSQQERERRAIKRDQRAALKLEREQAKSQQSSTTGRKRQRRQRNRKPDHDG